MIIFIVILIVTGTVAAFFSAITLAILDIYLSGHGQSWHKELFSMGPFTTDFQNLLFSVITVGGSFGSGIIFLWLYRKRNKEII